VTPTQAFAVFVASSAAVRAASRSAATPRYVAHAARLRVCILLRARWLCLLRGQS
jgi:hypothetical protein